MAIIITGGTGKTSSRIARISLDAKIPFLIASRKGQDGVPSGMPAVKFDWFDPTTFENPFQYKFANGENITAVYLVHPGQGDPKDFMNPFIDIAFKKYGVHKFVLLAGSTITNGGYFMGQVWKHLFELQVEHNILLATWFMENFTEWLHPTSIKQENKFYTACGDGKIPFVSADDIAASAFHCLTGTKPHQGYRILGPELLTMDEAAAKISKALGRTIRHVKLPDEESTKRFQEFGLAEDRAKFMTGLETGTAAGAEGNFGAGSVRELIGRPPMTFDEWAQKNKNAWN
ncbi:Agroclavine dehydrogenase [Lachnellula suecica]|uniref:Agroclavine dehydrogenase n=1 Tax=Lachnellula suecica TaxID=602035 RepID=A0A8T9CLQ8_9HELO|nr:Agroclavine dehydrogenase [Lachnellula suecica]